jgi:hypothetical protein
MAADTRPPASKAPAESAIPLAPPILGGVAPRQRIYSQNISMTETKFYPVQARYAWPSELDLMARLAGLRLRERWGGWRREPFTASSTRYVSVYGREP